MEMLEAEYEEFAQGVDDGTQFRISEGLRLSAVGGSEVESDEVARVLALLGAMAVGRPILADLVRSIVRCASFGERFRPDHEAGLFRDARRVLSRIRFDRVRAREGARLEEVASEWTRGEKLLVLVTLRSLCEGWQGPGWAERRMAEDHEVRLPEAPSGAGLVEERRGP